MNPIVSFFHGAGYFYSSIGKLFRSPKLLALAFIPILLTLIVIGGLAWSSAWLVGNLWSNYLTVSPDGQLLVQALTVLIVLYVAYLIYLPLTRIFLAPISEKISLKTSHLNGNILPKENELGFFKAIWEGIKLVTLQLIIVVLVLLLTVFLPPLGVPLGIFVTICFCGMDFLDVPLSMRGFSFRQKIGWWRKNTASVLGFSVAGYLLLHLPIVNLLALPVGIIGATRLIERATND